MKTCYSWPSAPDGSTHVLLAYVGFLVFSFLFCTHACTHTAETGPSEIFGSFMNRLKAEFPDWNAAHATPEQSVTAMLGVISKLTAKDSGACLSHKGDTENWV